uniref:AID-like deaminase 1 n=1 Tax=Lingula anatina TaxID=7574 RepID=A0A2U8JQ31_LINAN|nr:AID-like deaminase 1 [Lingula anatina]
MAHSTSYPLIAPRSPVMSLTEVSGDFPNIWADFTNSGPHGRPWPMGKTHLIVHFPENVELPDMYTCSRPVDPYPYNTPGVHAEMNAIPYLENRGVKKVVMYLNWSPCSDCSSVLKAFVETKRSDPDFFLEIVFRGVYKIRRQSCTRKCNCQTVPGNSEGLYNLSLLEPVCTLRSFNRKDWQDLERLLDKKDPNIALEELSIHDQPTNDEMDVEIATDLVAILRNQYKGYMARPPIQDVALVPLKCMTGDIEGILDDFGSSGPHFYPNSKPRTHLILHFPRDDLQSMYTCTSFGFNETHAEKHAISYLKKRQETGRIVMYLNWAPCHGCSNALIALIQEKVSEPDFFLEIVFRGICYSRPSCTVHCGCFDENPEGLRELSSMKPYCTVRSFNRQDWKDLEGLLDNIERSHRESIDGDIAHDFRWMQYQ